MQTKKMSLANIQGKLSRSEMKKIMAGDATCATCLDARDGVVCGTSNCTHSGVPRELP